MRHNKATGNLQLCQKCARKYLIWISCIFPGIILLVILNMTFNRGPSSESFLKNQVFPSSPLNPVRVSSSDSKHVHSTNKMKVILGWHKIFVPQGDELFKRLNCDVQDCIITYNRNLLYQSDAVLVRIPLGFTPPPRISPAQRWVFVSHESPLKGKGQKVELYYESPDIKGVFNWTMTYRSDSDIPFTWGKDFGSPTEEHDRAPQNLLRILKSKPKKVAWIVSHCKTESKRELYVKEMQKYISVDIYGACGNLTTPQSRTEGRNKDRATMQLINNTYLFFLSFENSLCQEYITEKFFRILPYDIIPVVRGGSGYSNLVPYKWYINTKDFSSPKELAEYLLHLADNPEQMLQYFLHKHEYHFDVANWNENLAFCTLCKKLNDPNEPVKIYEDIGKWWSNNACEPVKDIPGLS